MIFVIILALVVVVVVGYLVYRRRSKQPGISDSVGNTSFIMYIHTTMVGPMMFIMILGLGIEQ